MRQLDTAVERCVADIRGRYRGAHLSGHEPMPRPACFKFPRCAMQSLLPPIIYYYAVISLYIYRVSFDDTAALIRLTPKLPKVPSASVVVTAAIKQYHICYAFMNRAASRLPPMSFEARLLTAALMMSSAIKATLRRLRSIARIFLAMREISRFRWRRAQAFSPLSAATFTFSAFEAPPRPLAAADDSAGRGFRLGRHFGGLIRHGA